MNVYRGAATRRDLLRTGAVVAAGLIAGPAMADDPIGDLIQNTTPTGVARPSTTAMPASPMTFRPDLFRRALAALSRHSSEIARQDRIALVDFDLPSSRSRFHIVDLASGRSQSLLVAHGRGSDPAHTGFLTLFSNEVGSAASSSGAYVTKGDVYIGEHGRSQRLVGLDRTNNNVEERAIVVHAAWYVSQDMIAQHGKIGRSEGCFALTEDSLEIALNQLGAGRMIYADKV
ncbi:MAG TPA: murein L,D-transpeptidase catalytic domain family protein [Sphingomonas sp.]